MIARLMIALGLFGAFSLTAAESTLSKTIPTTPQFPALEVGASAGFPTILGIQLGYFGSEKLPLLFRTTLGMGVTADLGVHLPVTSSPDSRLILAATGGMIGVFGLFDDPLFNVGPTVGIRTGSFFAQAGPALYFPSRGGVTLAAQGQLGFSALY